MPKHKWTFITNHAAVLTLLDREEQLTSRAIALSLGITERSVVRIIKDLETDGYITKRREGRENRYKVNKDLPLPQVDQQEVQVRKLLQLISQKE
jgi:predicted transcriptional regulator